MCGVHIICSGSGLVTASHIIIITMPAQQDLPQPQNDDHAFNYK